MRHRRIVGSLAAGVVAVTLAFPASAIAASGDGGGAGSGAGSGGGEEGGGDTTGSDYSDLVILLRGQDGTPVLKKFLVPAEDVADPPTVEYCVQPVSYAAVPGIPKTQSPLDGKDVYVLPLQGEWLETPVDPLPVAEIEPCDPQPQFAMFVSEVELERLNMARTSESVLDDKIAAVKTKLLAADVIDLDPAGRIRLDGVAIDAAPEHAGIYQSLMYTGAIPGLPSDMTGSTSVGPAPSDAGFNSRFDAWELAAAAVGTAASKGVPINVDSIEYYNQVTGFPPDTATADYSSPWGVQFLRSEDPANPGTRLTEGRRYVDFSGFTYSRAATYPGSVTWLNVKDLEWHVSDIIGTVPFTRAEANTGTLHGVEAFAQMADDTRAVILFLHANEVILPGFYMDPVGVDTTDAQLEAITNPAVDLGVLPEQVFQTEQFGITASLFNPHAGVTSSTGGSLIDTARLRIGVDAEQPLAPEQLSAVALDGQAVPFAADGSTGDLTGWWGPAEGFPVPPGYHASTDFKVTVADGAPVGPYRVTLELVDIATPSEVLASDTGQVTVNDNVPTVIWDGEVPAIATQGSYVTVPLRVFAPSVNPEQLELVITGPGDDPLTPDVTESLAAGDAKVYASNGTSMVAMPLALNEQGKLVGTWAFTTAAGYTDVDWYLTFATGGQTGGYPIDIRLIGGNALDTEVIGVSAPETHGEKPPGAGEDTIAPEVKVEVVGTLGAEASFLLSTAVPEEDVTYSCRLTKDDLASAWVDCTKANGGGAASYTGLVPGAYVFTARALDKAGNSSDVVTRSWVVGAAPVPGGSGGGSDVTPPVAKIVNRGTPGTTASFTLTTDPAEPGVVYACRLAKDGVPGAWESCATAADDSTSYTGLEPGSYVLEVTATDLAGNVSAVVTTTWLVPDVVGQGDPDTSVLGGPEQYAWVLADSVRYQLGSDTEGARFEVRVNGRIVGTCASGDCVVQKLVPGRNRIRFAAMVGGLTDKTPEIRTVFVPYGAYNLERSAGWRMREGNAHLFGQYVQTKQEGSVLRHWYRNVRRVALVASTGDGFGKVHVYMNQRRLTDRPINLGAYQTQAMRLIQVKTFDTARKGTVRVVVVSDGRTVRIDGLGIAPR